VREKKPSEVCGTTSAKTHSLALVESYGEGKEPITDRREENDFNARSSGATDEEHPVHQDTCCSCKEKEAKIEQLQSKIRQPFEGIVPKDMADELLYQLEKSVEVC
jgi:hypothetical protein